MNERVTVELPAELAQRARAVAAQTHRRLEQILVDWIDRAAAGPGLEGLPDDQLLELCDGQVDSAHQEELSDLLARNRENALFVGERERLDGLMQPYRQGLVRKAQALQLAVVLGLRPRLS
jgi:hypothetical protein